MELRCRRHSQRGLPLDSRSNLHYGMADSAAAAVATPDAKKKEEDGGGVPPPPAHELTKKSSVISAEEGKEGKEDGSGNKEESVLGAALAQAPTTEAGTAAMPAAVPRKELPVDEEAEEEAARQKAKHTGYWVRSKQRAELSSDVWSVGSKGLNGMYKGSDHERDMCMYSAAHACVVFSFGHTLTLSRVRTNNTHAAARIVAWQSSSLSTCEWTWGTAAGGGT